MIAALTLTISLLTSPATVWWAERTVDPARGWNATLQIQSSAATSHVQVEMWRTECTRSGCVDVHMFGSTDLVRPVVSGSRASVLVPVTTVRSRDGGDDLHELSRSSAVMALRVILIRPSLMSVSLGRYSWVSTAAGVLVEN